MKRIIFLIFVCFWINLGTTSQVLAEEETIFLPFPDLTRDLEPEQFPDNSNAIDKASILPDDQGTQDKLKKENRSSELKSTIDSTNRNKAKSNTSNPNSNSVKSSTAKNSKITKTNPKEKTNLSKADQNKIASSDLMDFPTSDEDKEAFRKSMEAVRLIESKEPAKAIAEYEKLLNKFMNPSTVARIRIYMAWNYFHRKQFQDSLIQVLEILDDPDLLEGREYPIALYLAGRIHEEKWNGAIKKSSLSYYKLFLDYHKRGLTNFRESRFKDEINKRLENDRSIRADRII